VSCYLEDNSEVPTRMGPLPKLMAKEDETEDEDPTIDEECKAPTLPAFSSNQ